MRKILKFILKTLILVLIIGFSFIQYLKSDFNSPFDQNQLNELKYEIKNSSSIPLDFIKVYNQINPITDTNGFFYDAMKEDYYYRECPCLNVAKMSFFQVKNRLKVNEYVLAWKLEKDFTQEECLNFYLKYYDFLYNNKGIRSASKYYFQKELTNLNFDEMATLVIMLKNPSLYNPFKNPERVKKRINKIVNETTRN